MSLKQGVKVSGSEQCLKANENSQCVKVNGNEQCIVRFDSFLPLL